MNTRKKDAGDKRKISIYVNNMDLLRTFLELASYGVYSRLQMKQKMDSPGTYDKRLKTLNYCLSSYNSWQPTKKGKKVHYSFHVNAYHPDMNYLYPIFSMKNISIKKLFYDIIILHVLNQCPEGITRGQVIQYTRDDNSQFSVIDVIRNLFASFEDKELAKFNTYHNFSQVYEMYIKDTPTEEDDLVEGASLDIRQNKENEKAKPPAITSQIQRRLQDLSEYGFIQHFKKKSQHCYKMNPSPFTGLTSSELEELRQAIAFYIPISFLPLPGYDLYTYHLNPEQKKWPDKLIVRNNNSIRIANDDLLYFLQDAIQQNLSVKFIYKNREVCGRPLSFYFDTYQREYVSVYNGENPDKYHIYQMSEVSDSQEKFEPSNISMTYPFDSQIYIQLFYHSETEHQALLRQIQEKGISFEEADIQPHSSHCTLNVEDPLFWVPWLRTLQPQIKYLGDNTKSTTVRKHMVDYLQEALAQYE